MRHHRFSVAIVFVAFTVLVARSALGQGAFPERPLRIVVGFAGGGFADITVRLLAERMSPLLGQPVVVENMPGAGGVVAAQSVLKSKPDGHTLFLLVNGHAAAKAVFKSLAFDPVKDFAPIGLLAYFDLLIVAKGDGPHRTLANLIGAARTAPGKVNIGTINPGSTQNLAAELFKATANLSLSVVPYKGTPDLAVAVLGDQLDALVDTYTALKAQIDAGRLRALASTGAQRSTYLPNVPTIREAGIADYEVIGWNSLAAPLATPPAVIATLNRHLNAVVSAADFKKRLLDLGAEPGGGPPDDLARRVAGDVAKWEAIVAKAGLPRL